MRVVALAVLSVILMFGLTACNSNRTGPAAPKPDFKPAFFSVTELAAIERAIEEGSDDLTLIAVTTPGESKSVIKKIIEAGGVITYDSSDPEIGYDGSFLVFTVRPSQAVPLVKDLKLKAVAVDRRFAVDFSLIKNNPDDPRLPNRISPKVARVIRGQPNPYLPVHETGALEFRKNTGADGRATTIAVVDTGIALGHEGLTERVIDYKDTTGEGDVVLTPTSVTRSESKVLVDSPLGKLDVTEIADGAENFRVGVFSEEQKIQGGDLEGDLNRNKKADDKIAIVTFQKKDAKGALAWFGAIDNDLDLALSAGEATANFRDGLRGLKLGQGANKGIVEVALDISADGSRVNLGFDGGAHGTHVAGIAAGSGLLGGRMDGAAPAAKLMAVKVLQTRGFGTDSMVLRGMIYAATHGADVINMSLGDRELKGGEDPQTVLIRDLSERYGTIFSISAGNSGPAIDTIGTPGAVSNAITSGAYVSAATYASNYGALGLRDGIFYFSSVGPTILGALKPTIVSPGSAVSAVPSFAGGYAMYNGTSMAAPQTSGAIALLLSKAKQDKLGIVTDPARRRYLAAAVKTALGMSARHVDGYGPLEEGYGLLNIPDAYEVLKRIDALNRPVFDYVQFVTSQLTQNGRGAGAYYRNSSAVESETFDVSRLLPHGMSELEAANLSELAFELRATPTYRNGEAQPICHVSGAQPMGFGIAGNQSLKYNVSFNTEALEKPGAYSTRLDGYNVDTGLLETSLLATAVKPYNFTAETSAPYSFYFRNVKLKGGRVHRYFFVVPANATGLSVKLHVPENQSGRVRVNINDPAGTSYANRTPFATRTSDEVFVDANTTINTLTPGVWEVDVYAAFAQPLSIYNLRVSLSAVSVQPSKLAMGRTGGAGSFSVRNDLVTGTTDFKVLDQGFAYRERKSIQFGYSEFRPIEITQAMLAPGAKSVPVTVILDNPQFKEDVLYADFTDEQKRPFVQLGLPFDQKFFGQTVVLSSELKPGRYFVQLQGMFVPKGETTFDYEERFVSPIGAVKVEPSGRSGFFDLYTVQVEAKATPPQGYGLFTRVMGVDRGSQQPQVIVPVYLSPQ